MKKIIGILILIGSLFLGGCSTKKDTFISRNYHNITSKYNVLYNGNMALEKGIEELNMKYEDNFWELLPVEPLKVEDELLSTLDSEGKKGTTSFDIAEEKAVKAVQKHSMNINDIERNRQMDDAYLLLGKARYYSQRFVPAFEAFDFIEKNFPKTKLNQDLYIWKAKTLVRLQNEELARTTLKALLRKTNLEEDIKEKAHTALAMTYIASDSIPQAIKQLRYAVATDTDKKQHARNLFILGQLYKQEQHIDSSQWAFQEVLNFRKAPRKYKIHAHIEQAKNATDSLHLTTLQNKFKKLVKDSENRSYLDELYYQIALMDFAQKNEKKALKNLFKSIHTPRAKDFQKSLSYETMGNYYFDKAKFVKAGAYYDSVMLNVMDHSSKRIRRLKRKRESLDEVIVHEMTLKKNDSVLYLVTMNDDKRIVYFEEYIAKLKKADEIAAILKENAQKSGSVFAGSAGKNTTGKWYFYNPQSLAFGKAEFQKVWGNRTLQDNWRWYEKSVYINEDTADTDKDSITDDTPVDHSQKYNVAYYIDQIPTEEEKIQALYEENSNVLYQLGLIYKEKFQEYSLAAERLERFLSEKPTDNLILPAKYHLYKIYEITGNLRSEQLQQEIVTDYPDSRFATIIQNPEKVIYGDATDTPEANYEKVYSDFELENYVQVLEQCDKAIQHYANDPIQAKFELLKSYALFKTEGKEAFVKGLEWVVATYPKTEESEHAQRVLATITQMQKSKKPDTSPTPLTPEKIKKTEKTIAPQENKATPSSPKKD